MVQPSPNIQLMGESWSTLGSCPGGLDISTGPLFCGPKISFLQAKKDSSDQPTSYSFAGGSGRAVSALASPQNSQCGGCGLPLKTCTCKSILYTCFLWGVCVCVCTVVVACFGSIVVLKRNWIWSGSRIPINTPTHKAYKYIYMLVLKTGLVDLF